MTFISITKCIGRVGINGTKRVNGFAVDIIGAITAGRAIVIIGIYRNLLAPVIAVANRSSAACAYKAFIIRIIKVKIGRNLFSVAPHIGSSV